MKLNLFGKEIQTKTHYCSFFGEPGDLIENPYITLYLQTKHCNADCKFCEYKSSACSWNGKKYEEILTHIADKIDIRKIGITGGEPTLNWDNFIEMSEISDRISPKSELSLNTNGFNWEKLITHPIFEKYDYINLSRHHYNDKLNNEIFKTDLLPSTENLKQMVEAQVKNHQLQFRCNLINGFIDSKEEIFKYLDWSNEIGINDIGLISLMPVNDYSIDNKILIDINELVGDNFFLTKKWERCEGGCTCCNYVYTPENFKKPIIVYQKNTFNPGIIKETLVYDGENLRLGFDGDIIY